MENTNIQNKGQARLFKNRYLEMLTKTSPVIIWSIYGPLICYLIYYSKLELLYCWKGISALFFSAVLFWSFFEYVAHRYIFHWISKKTAIMRLTYTLHGNH